MADTVNWMRLRLGLVTSSHPLHRKQCVLGTAVAFFADAAFLAPKIAIDGVALRHFVVAIALGEVHLAAVTKLAQQAQHLPFNIGGRSFCRIVEKNLVLNLQAARSEERRVGEECRSR